MIDVTRRRRNGWTFPLHPYQLVAWVTLLLLILGNGFALAPVPLFPLPPALTTLCFVWIFVWMVTLTSVDPGFGSPQTVPREFDRRQGRVIIDDYCRVCDCHVPANTKHCRQCNKCVAGFDHHCKWLNTCIGCKNYRKFIIFVVSIAVVTLVAGLVIVVFLVLFAIHFPPANSQNGKNGIMAAAAKEVQSESGTGLPWLTFRYVDMWLWVIVGCCAAVADLVVFLVSAHLLHFHVMLWKSGHTTYSYFTHRNFLEKMATHNQPASTSVSLGRNARVADCSANRPFSVSAQVSEESPEPLRRFVDPRSPRPHTAHARGRVGTPVPRKLSADSEYPA